MILDHPMKVMLLGLMYTVSKHDIRKTKNVLNQKKTEFSLSANIPAGIYGYALVLSYKLVSISSDGPRHFDLI